MIITRYWFVGYDLFNGCGIKCANGIEEILWLKFLELI